MSAISIRLFSRQHCRQRLERIVDGAIRLFQLLVRSAIGVRSEFDERLAEPLEPLAERADAYVQFAHAPHPSSRAADLTAAERDYTEALDIYAKLQAAGTFSASDTQYVDHARTALDKIRNERPVVKHPHP